MLSCSEEREHREERCSAKNSGGCTDLIADGVLRRDAPVVLSNTDDLLVVVTSSISIREGVSLGDCSRTIGIATDDCAMLVNNERVGVLGLN
jgi:hypothetical protein